MHRCFMFRPFGKLVALAIGGALWTFAAGCQVPAFERPDATPRTASQPKVKELPKPPTSEPARGTDAVDPVTAAADEATVAAVMKEVDDLGTTHPEAQKLLLAELRRSKPSMWPLIVEQFRASLALHEQLMSKPPMEPEAASDISNQMTAAPPSPTEPLANAAEPPSATFGKLGDPRHSRPDPAIEKLFANATPANMPAPEDASFTALAASAPREFAEDSAAMPIVQQSSRQQMNVVPASATTSTEANRETVQPALYRVESTAPTKELEWQDHLNLAVEGLDRRLVGEPNSTAEVHQFVSLRLLKLLAGRTEEALVPVPRISPEEQDYWADQIFALASFLDHHTQPDDKRRAAASVIHLDEAVGHLRELGALSLRNLTFCSKVYGYGTFDAIDSPKFSPGEQLTLYVEVENYHSESTAKGYTTMLGASYEIRDEKDQRIDGGEFPPVEDCCRSRRRDFHIQYGLVLPKTLAPGEYRLDLMMKDRQSDKLGHASIEFDVVRQ